MTPRKPQKITPIFKTQHNKKLLSIFLKLTNKLNQIGITPITYGSLGLSLLIGEHSRINDIDLILTDTDFSNHWGIINMVIMDKLGYKLDSRHWQEFNGNNIPVSFIKLSDIQKLTPINTDQLKKEKIGKATYYNLSLPQYLDIYKNGLHNKYRKQGKGRDDKEKISLVEQHL